MFKGLKVLAAMLPMVAVSFAMADRGNEIVGTAHDFSAKAWSGNQVCLPCHTPHHAKPASVSGRLWNHELSTATFTLNANNTGSVPGQGVEMLDRVSQMCMGCHDGVTAIDAYGSHTPVAGPASGSINIGTDLTNDHPVGLYAIYDENRQHSNHYSYKELTTVSAAGLRLVDVANGKLRTRQADGSYVTTDVPNAKVVGCGTCHNPHGGVDYYINGSAIPKRMLLRADPRTICISCHTK